MDEKGRPVDRPIVMGNRAWEWGLALALHVFFFILMLEYHRWRGRGYLDGGRMFLFTANKAMGIASLLSLSFALAAGPLERLAGLPAIAVRLRRPAGVVGAFGILPHVLASVFFMGWKFDWPYYVKHWVSIVLGAAALLGVLWLAAISWPWALRRLGPARWRAFQQAGYALVLVVFLHGVVFTGKLANWPDWFGKIGKPGNPPVPPGSFVSAVSVAAVLALKAADWIAGAVRRKP